VSAGLALFISRDGRTDGCIIRPVSRSYVSALEARIKTLEDVIRATAGAVPPEDVEDVAWEASDRRPCNPARHEVADGKLPEDSGASIEAIMDIGRLRLCVSKTEKGDTMNDGDTSNFCYYGPTSGRYFASTQEPEPSLPHTYVQCDLKRSLDARKGMNIFEDEHELSLLNKFWVWQDIHCTVVERALFIESYKNGERDSEWVSPMLIDMMLAIGEQFGHKGHDGRRAVYSARAESTVVHELGRPRMSTMQAVQLMAIFQMGAGRVSVGWSLNGEFNVTILMMAGLCVVSRFGGSAVQQTGSAYRFYRLGYEGDNVPVYEKYARYGLLGHVCIGSVREFYVYFRVLHT
jgi:hypothetical protein